MGTPPSLALSYQPGSSLSTARSPSHSEKLMGKNCILFLTQPGPEELIAGSCRVCLVGRRLGRGGFWGESWLCLGQRHKVGARAACEPAEALKWSCTPIPTAPPARSRASQLHFSRRPGISLLGTIFGGKNPALLSGSEGWSSSFHESSNLEQRDTAQKKSSPTHALV